MQMQAETRTIFGSSQETRDSLDHADARRWAPLASGISSELFVTWQWAEALRLTREMTLPGWEAELLASAPALWFDHLREGPAALRLAILEAVPPQHIADHLPTLMKQWRPRDPESWAKGLTALAACHPREAVAEAQAALKESRWLPRGQLVSGLTQVLPRLGNDGLAMARRWHKRASKGRLPAEYLWAGYFTCMATCDVPLLHRTVLSTLRSLPGGAREVALILHELFRAQAPEAPSLEMFMNLRAGAGYLMEDLPELFQQTSNSRLVDELVVSLPGFVSPAMLRGQLLSPGPYRRLRVFAYELLNATFRDMRNEHFQEIESFALGAAATLSLNNNLNMDLANDRDLLDLLTCDLHTLPQGEGIRQTLERRLGPQQASMLMAETRVAAHSRGLPRLVRLTRSCTTRSFVAWYVSLLTSRSLPSAQAEAAGALVEEGRAALQELERSFSKLDCTGKSWALNIMGFLDPHHASPVLASLLRHVLHDQDLLERWAVAAQNLGTHEIAVAASRFAGRTSGPMPDMVESRRIKNQPGVVLGCHTEVPCAASR